MVSATSYAAAVSTPNGTLRQPQIQARACSDPDLRSSFESQMAKKPQTKPQRPGAGIRSKTSFRGWASKKGQDSADRERGVVREVQHSHETKSEHKPNTGGAEEHVYVLTFKLEESLSRPMNEMRQEFFPKKINRTPAHLTLFHTLPHSQMDVLEQSLVKLSARTRPFQVTTGGPFRMRKGVGVNVDAGYQKMKEVHGHLKAQWMPFLSEQDQGGFRPHWTVMNKVDEEEAIEHALAAVRKELSLNTREGYAIGLELWKYDRGNWIWTKEYILGEEKRLSRTPMAFEGNGKASKLSINGGSSQQSPPGGSGKRPGLMKRGSSVADAWKSMSFRRRS